MAQKREIAAAELTLLRAELDEGELASEEESSLSRSVSQAGHSQPEPDASVQPLTPNTAAVGKHSSSEVVSPEFGYSGEFDSRRARIGPESTATMFTATPSHQYRPAKGAGHADEAS